MVFGNPGKNTMASRRMVSRGTIFIFLLGASVGLIPFLWNGMNSYAATPTGMSGTGGSDSYVRIAERRSQTIDAQHTQTQGQKYDNGQGR